MKKPEKVVFVKFFVLAEQVILFLAKAI